MHEARATAWRKDLGPADRLGKAGRNGAGAPRFGRKPRLRATASAPPGKAYDMSRQQPPAKGRKSHPGHPARMFRPDQGPSWGIKRGAASLPARSPRIAETSPRSLMPLCLNTEPYYSPASVGVICCIMPSMSQAHQLSTIWPPAKRYIVWPENVTGLPVAGMPPSSPP